MATKNAIDSSNPIEVAKGGIGVATLTDHGVLIGSGTGAVTPLSVGSDGQVLVGSTGADPVFATLTSTGGSITFTPGAGTLNLECGGMIWKEVFYGETLLSGHHGYVASPAIADAEFLLPASASAGDTIAICLSSVTYKWKITQNADQQIRFGSATTTLGVTGYLQSTLVGDCVELVCLNSNAWMVRSSIGDITIA